MSWVKSHGWGKTSLRLSLAIARHLCHHIGMNTGDNNIQTAPGPRGTVMWRAVPLDQADRDFDLMFWQSQSPAARFAAAWELVQTAWMMKGRPAHELRLQRTAHHLERLPG